MDLGAVRNGRTAFRRDDNATQISSALSLPGERPIDLIADFIPILGYLDDLIIVPFGIWLVISLIPEEIMVEHRTQTRLGSPSSTAGTITIIVFCIFAVLTLGWIWLTYWGRPN
jgi:Protein of unknown function (DUF1232)